MPDGVKATVNKWVRRSHAQLTFAWRDGTEVEDTLGDVALCDDADDSDFEPDDASESDDDATVVSDDASRLTGVNEENVLCTGSGSAPGGS